MARQGTAGVGAPGVIDLRSDTVTRPTAAMREAIAGAVVGDDVFGDDPTMNALQEKVAALLGKERALFMPSGTMSNAVAVKILTQPGDEAIVEAGSHMFNYESASAAFNSGVQLSPLPGRSGFLDAGQVEAAIRPSDSHFPRTRLVCVENTANRAGGTVFPLDELERIGDLAGRHGLAVHLDGARLWNASVASGVQPDRYAACADTVSVCLSKGLGAPVGSLLAGSKELMAQAHRVRKVLGGGMRQAGVLAAAGIYAIDAHWARMAEDHANARLLAAGLQRLRDLDVEPEVPPTNILLGRLRRDGWTGERLARELAERGVLIIPIGADRFRAVTHLDVDREGVLRAVDIFGEILEGREV